MPEFVPKIDQESIDFAWEAALKANQAHTKLQEVRDYYVNLGQNLLTETLDYREPLEGLNDQDNKYDAASFDLEFYSSMAAPAMLMPNSPFASTHEIVPSEPLMDKRDVKDAELLAGLPEAYAERAVRRFQQTRESVDRYTLSGVMPFYFRLESLAEFSERLHDLEPYFTLFEELDWQPEIVFVPKFLRPGDWDSLFTAQSLTENIEFYVPNAQVGPVDINFSNGTDLNITGDKPSRTYHTWDVAVVCSKTTPQLLNLPKDGLERAALKILRTIDTERLTETDGSTLSPSLDVYLATQLARIERGEVPFDMTTGTFLKEDLVEWGQNGVQPTSVYARFDLESLQIKVRQHNPASSQRLYGIRPTIAAEYLSEATEK